jgi:hypothetical protein
VAESEFGGFSHVFKDKDKSVFKSMMKVKEEPHKKA